MNGGLKKVLMCEPRYFFSQGKITYAINFYMHSGEPVDRIKVLEDWWYLVDVYRSLGLEVELLPPQPDLLEMCFTANAGFWRKKYFIVSNFRPEQRRAESPHFKNWFSNNGYAVVELPLPSQPDLINYFFEGKADMAWINSQNKILFGHGIRSSYNVKKYLRQIIEADIEIIPIRLIDERFYHLDTCLAYYPEKDVLVFYPKAFSRQSLEEIKKLRISHLIELDEKDALNLVANSLSVNGVVVANKFASKEFISRIRRCGLEIILVDTSEFRKAGGSVHCLTLKLD